MPWRQLKLHCRAEQSEALEDGLLAAGAQSITLSDAEDSPVLEPLPGEIRIWPEVIVTALFDADTDTGGVLETLRGLGLEWDSAEWELLQDREWERAWMDDFRPMRFGQRLWVCPSWCTPPEPGAVNLLFDPGLAFGSGTHPTTALCLEWLDAHPPQGLDVIDYGCGSGILAIAALRLGARHATGLDIDPQAIEATQANAERNAIAPERLRVALVGAHEPAAADLVLANILAGPLTELAPELSRLVRPGGRLVLSGILREQADDLIEAYAAQGLMMEAPELREDWARVEGYRPQAPDAPG
ncbi:MAG: 50S ribosomal protein L11 methyltransferase [Gammaproteobacteria bacterium]|nr:MAG: 50S ribosomal protein L11 methyltransferase [Gammaproteobacteria bacterium]